MAGLGFVAGLLCGVVICIGIRWRWETSVETRNRAVLQQPWTLDRIDNHRKVLAELTAFDGCRFQRAVEFIDSRNVLSRLYTFGCFDKYYSTVRMNFHAASDYLDLLNQIEAGLKALETESTDAPKADPIAALERELAETRAR